MTDNWSNCNRWTTDEVRAEAWKEVEKLSPGSDEAIALGCACPVLDNRHGRGRYTDQNGQRVYVYNMSCPVHGIMSDD